MFMNLMKYFLSLPHKTAAKVKPQRWTLQVQESQRVQILGCNRFFFCN